MSIRPKDGAASAAPRVVGVSAEVLRELRERLESAFGERLHEVLVYGSRVRGDARPDSDLDLMVVLEPPIHLWDDIRTGVHATYPLQLSIDYPIQIMPVSLAAHQAAGSPVVAQATEEGIRL